MLCAVHARVASAPLCQKRYYLYGLAKDFIDCITRATKGWYMCTAPLNRHPEIDGLTYHHRIINTACTVPICAA